MKLYFIILYYYIIFYLVILHYLISYYIIIKYILNFIILMLYQYIIFNYISFIILYYSIKLLWQQGKVKSLHSNGFNSILITGYVSFLIKNSYKNAADLQSRPYKFQRLK